VNTVLPDLPTDPPPRFPIITKITHVGNTEIAKDVCEFLNYPITNNDTYLRGQHLNQLEEKKKKMKL
jgi:hypothetical protein